MIFFFVAAWLAYKRAKENGRNGVVWALITSAAFIVAQLATGAAIAFLLLVANGFDSGGEDLISRYELLINIASIVVSIAVVWLILRFLNKVPEDNSFTPPPAPPIF